VTAASAPVSRSFNARASRVPPRPGPPRTRPLRCTWSRPSGASGGRGFAVVMAPRPYCYPSPPRPAVLSPDRVPMGRERNTDHRSDIRAQRGGMIPCVPSQDLCGVSTPNFGTRRLSDIGEMPRYSRLIRDEGYWRGWTMDVTAERVMLRHSRSHRPCALCRVPRAGRTRSEPDRCHHRQPEREKREKGGLRRSAWP
jgi:hypothetical protein